MFPTRGYRYSFQADLDCGDYLLRLRVSPLPLLQSGVNNNTYTQGSATLHPPMMCVKPPKSVVSSFSCFLEQRSYHFFSGVKKTELIDHTLKGVSS